MIRLPERSRVAEADRCGVRRLHAKCVLKLRSLYSCDRVPEKLDREILGEIGKCGTGKYHMHPSLIPK